MAASNTLPLASTITLAQFNYALSLHPLLMGELTQQALDKVLKKGEGSIADETLRKDRLRYEELPQTVESRKQAGAWMDKKEVQALMVWKLKYGKFRPQLPALVASNDATVVHDTTKAGFALYEASKTDYAAALKELAKLKGIGPATASLLLSVYDEENVPFFSDELFRWVCWDAQVGWKRKIKYDMKEYEMLRNGVVGLREKLGGKVKAVNLEKVAYVCGRLGVDKKLAETVQASVTAEKEREEDSKTVTFLTAAGAKAMKKREQASQKEAEKEAEIGAQKDAEKGLEKERGKETDKVAEKEYKEEHQTQPAPKRKQKAATIPDESENEVAAPRAKRTRRG